MPSRIDYWMKKYVEVYSNGLFRLDYTWKLYLNKTGVEIYYGEEALSKGSDRPSLLEDMDRNNIVYINDPNPYNACFDLFACLANTPKWFYFKDSNELQ
jgi:hypothetical protein